MSDTNVRFYIKPTDVLIKSRGLEPGGRVQTYIDNEVIKRCAKKVPKDTGKLVDSAETASRVGYGEIRYRTKYAKKQYYQNKGKGERGRLWFERMKQQHRKAILAGAQRMAGGK